MAKQVTKYIVSDEESHEYDLIVTKSKNKTTFELFHTDNPIWTLKARSKLAFVLVNTGNNFKLPKKMRKIGYSESNYLRVLLAFENQTLSPANRTTWRFINADNEIKI